MAKPATWKDDPGCGHEVACAYQTHYCTYIRAPRLLTLQRPQTDQPAEMLAILALQAYELWLAVLISDLRAALERLAAGDASSECSRPKPASAARVRSGLKKVTNVTVGTPLTRPRPPSILQYSILDRHARTRCLPK